MVTALALSLIFSFSVSAQTERKSNLEVLEQNISAEIEKILYYPDVNRELQFVFYLTAEGKDKAEEKFIKYLLKRTAERNKIRFSFSRNDTMKSNEEEYYKFKVDIKKLATRYTGFEKNKFLGEKTLIRNLSSELDIHLEYSGSAQNIDLRETIKTEFKGEIPYDEYRQYENDEYPFTKSVPPDISFFETIVFPVSVVIVSALSVILFFVVRSK